MTDSGGGNAILRRVVAVGVALLLVAAATAAGVGSVAGSSAATDPTGESNVVKFVYVDNDNVTFMLANGTSVRTSGADAEHVGPMADLDSDGRLEAPYVTSNGDLKAVDANNETHDLADNVPYSKTSLGVDDWTGDGIPEVLYADADSKHLRYANVSGTAQISDEKASGLLGAVDFDGHGEREIVYIGTSKTLHYYNSSGATEVSYQNFGDKGAAGAPVDIYQDGSYWVPAIDGSGYPEVVNANGTTDQFRDSSNNTKKTPIAGVDWAGDGDLEIVHLQNSDLAYTYINGTTRKIRDESGDSVSAEKSAGVAGVSSYPDPLSVEEFEANATGGQNVTVNVTTNHDLSSLDVSLSGPENTTLTLSDFAETGTSPYAYTATYNRSTDGEYTATLESASSAGDSVSPGTEDTASVDDVVPNVEAANLTDVTDGNGTVSPGDEVRVNATVTGDVGTVTADLAGFDAGTVELAHEDGDEYAANVTVGENVSEGDWNATVTASDGQGNEDATDTNALTVETADLSVALNDTETVEEDESVQLSPSSVSDATGDVDYEWTFGDGSSATGKTVTHTYAGDGTYEVTLTADDGSGDRDTASMSVTVTDETTIEGATTGSTTTTSDDGNGDSGDSDPYDPGGSGGVDDLTTSEPTTEPTTTTEQTTEPTETTTGTVTTTERATETATSTEVAAPTTSESTTTADPGADIAPPQSPGEAPGFGVVSGLFVLVAAAALALRE
ncbi:MULTISPECIES: PKD domain-containing protein [Halobacterium]|uniref:PKD domain-containing protein n=1 Tax=Halobacterium TaxID=2239 RepID=UPI00073F2F44|nr:MULTISPECIES: PKD domain-containing protein [Halobacterium]MCG1004542.1 PKD domain-containing protein [Halobacterium noricense]